MNRIIYSFVALILALSPDDLPAASPKDELDKAVTALSASTSTPSDLKKSLWDLMDELDKVGARDVEGWLEKRLPKIANLIKPGYFSPANATLARGLGQMREAIDTVIDIDPIASIELRSVKLSGLLSNELPYSNTKLRTAVDTVLRAALAFEAKLPSIAIQNRADHLRTLVTAAKEADAASDSTDTILSDKDVRGRRERFGSTCP